MNRICLSADSTANELASIAMCIHSLFGGLPVTARSKNKNGVRVEDNKVISYDYSGPMLERSIRENVVLKGPPPSGTYQGIPVTVAPIVIGGEAIAAIGVVDVSGSMDLKALMDQYASLQKQVGSH